MLKKDDERGFTLIEMMVVLLVIAMLLIITIPNVAKHSTRINAKGCSAFIKMVEAQTQAYRLDNKNKIPTITELKEGGYITETTCPDGSEIIIDSEGKVIKNGTTP